MSYRWVLLIIVTALGLATSACSRAPAPVVQTKKPAPFRVVALAPGIARIIRDLGCGDCIVGRHAFDYWTDSSIPIAGEQERVDYEALLRLKPTHIFLQWGERTLPTRLVDLSLEHNWKLVSFPMLTLHDLRSAIKLLDQNLSTPDPIPGFEKIGSDKVLAAWDHAMAHRAGIDPAKIGRVLILHSTKPPSALGPSSYHQQILQSLGADMAIVKGAAYMPMDAEDVLRINPDAIIIVQPRSAGAAPFPTPRDAESLKPHLGVIASLDIAAIKNGRVALIDNDMALIPGTNLVDFANELGEILMHWQNQPPPAAPSAR